jgi:hypothetical protein
VRSELSTNSHEPLQHKWRRSSDTGAAVSKRCRAALRRLAPVTAHLTGMSRDEVVRRGVIRGEIPLYGGAGLAAGLSRLMPREDDNSSPNF